MRRFQLTSNLFALAYTRENFLIIPYAGETQEVVGFICFNEKNGKTYYLDLPKAPGETPHMFYETKAITGCVRGQNKIERIYTQ